MKKLVYVSLFMAMCLAAYCPSAWGQRGDRGNSSGGDRGGNRGGQSSGQSSNNNSGRGERGSSGGQSSGQSGGDRQRGQGGPGGGMMGGPGGMTITPEMRERFQNMTPEQRMQAMQQMRQNGGFGRQQSAPVATPSAPTYAPQSTKDLNDFVHTTTWRKLNDDQRKKVVQVLPKDRPDFRKNLQLYVMSPDGVTTSVREEIEDFLTPRQQDAIRNLDNEQRTQATKIIESYTSASLVKKFFLSLPEADQQALKRMTPTEKRVFLESKGLALPPEVIASMRGTLDNRPALETAQNTTIELNEPMMPQMRGDFGGFGGRGGDRGGFMPQRPVMDEEAFLNDLIGAPPPIKPVAADGATTQSQ